MLRGLCWVLIMWCGYWCPFLFRNHLWEEIAGCFLDGCLVTVNVYVALPHSVSGWLTCGSVVVDSLLTVTLIV